MTRAMTHALTRVFAFALALTCVAATAAAAEEAAPAPSAMPTLRRTVTVTDDLVRIGDLVDNAGDLADTPIFRSPDAGTTGSVPVQQVLEVLRPYRLYRVNTQGFTEIEVSRSGRRIEVAEIEARIARTFAGRYGLGDAKNLRVTLDGMVQPITVDASAGVDLNLIGASLDPRSGRFEIAFGLPGSEGTRRALLRLTGAVIETVETVVLTQAVARGEVIKAADVAIERRPKAEVSGEPIVAVTDAIGLAVRQAMRAGQPVQRAQLTKPELVRRDDNVTLVYEVPGIVLTTRGRANEAGALGDTISVTNSETKRVIQGVVSGPSRVTIVATTARIPSATVAATPQSTPQSVASR
jgi:flagella basal body P-ring formation protein FlgA